MQIVIEIPKEAYELLQNKGVDWLGAEHILNAVANGTPLPDHYGRLIDCQAALLEFKRVYFDNATVLRCAEIILSNAPTIIPATKEGDRE